MLTETLVQSDGTQRPVTSRYNAAGMRDQLTYPQIGTIQRVVAYDWDELARRLNAIDPGTTPTAQFKYLGG